MCNLNQLKRCNKLLFYYNTLVLLLIKLQQHFLHTTPSQTGAVRTRVLHLSRPNIFPTYNQLQATRETVVRRQKQKP